MKIQLISDIHTEFHVDGGVSFARELPVDDADVLVVAGDFGSVSTLRASLNILCDRVPNVVFVAGNHEVYGSTFDAVDEVLTDLEDHCTHSNFHPLDGESCIIDGQRFLGATMWYKETPSSKMNWKKMPDYYKIMNFHEKVYGLNTRHVDFLNTEMQEGDVVVTHHLPTHKSIDPRFKDSLLNCYFLCDMESLISNVQPKLWLHGHTHASCDYKIGETRVVCNPMGYIGHGLNHKFNDHLIIGIP